MTADDIRNSNWTPGGSIDTKVLVGILVELTAQVAELKDAVRVPAPSAPPAVPAQWTVTESPAQEAPVAPQH